MDPGRLLASGTGRSVSPLLVNAVPLHFSKGNPTCRYKSQQDRLHQTTPAVTGTHIIIEKQAHIVVVNCWFTMGDVKTAARESGKMKWQEMWDKTEKGRHLFNYRNKVGLNLEHKYQSTKGEISVIQLRAGYVRLNEYLQKTNAVESNKCQCSQIESIGHYLLECPLYENQREKLRRKLFETCGIVHLDLNLLLDVKADDDYKEWRT